MITLALDDDALVGKILVAPPLGVTTLAKCGSTPMLVLSPAHDQFAPPDVAEPIVRTWPNTDFEVVESVDHFLLGRGIAVADRAAGWAHGRLAALDDAR